MKFSLENIWTTNQILWYGSDLLFKKYLIYLERERKRESKMQKEVGEV